MKTRQYYSLLLLVFMLASCTEPIVRDEPATRNEIVSLGFYSLSEASLNFSPYFEKNTLIFTDEDGTEYEWRMLQPVINDAASFQRTFPNPVRAGFVDYKYAGERAVFEFLCTDLGAKLVIRLEPDLCYDPRLDDDIAPINHLNIRGLGFNDGDVTITEPVLSIFTESNEPCRGRKLGEVQLGDRLFTNVTSNRMELGDRFLDVYYTPDEGVVGMRTTYMFLVLKEAF